MFRLSQQSEELSKKEKELQDLRNKLFRLVSESEQKKNEVIKNFILLIFKLFIRLNISDSVSSDRRFDLCFDRC